MKKFINFFFLLFIFSIFNGVYGQALLVGSLKYEITNIKADPAMGPQGSMIENTMKGTITKINFDQEKSLTRIQSMGGMSDIRILVQNSGDSEMYMDIMGQKIVNKVSKAESTKQSVEFNSKYKYIPYPQETKSILGHKCHKVELVAIDKADENSMKMIFWVTNEINSNAVVTQGIDNINLGGFPLESFVSIPGNFTMTSTCTEISADIDAKAFDFDRKGYKEMSLDQLKKMGMGTGF